MINIYEYLLGKKNKSLNTIHATNDTIRDIVKNELDKLGHKADLNHIDTIDVTEMNHLFSCANNTNANLNEDYIDLNPNISEWDVRNVVTMKSMFQCCENFNCDISKWDVRNVIDMRQMFWGCKKFNKDLSKWETNDNVSYSMWAHTGDKIVKHKKYWPHKWPWE